MLFRFCFATTLGLISPVSAAVYHVDSSQGDDARPGTTSETAWRSLEKVNATDLKPGDEVRFKAGERWTGQFAPQGAGNADALVRIGRYGDGDLPRIDGEGRAPDTVLLRNFPFVEITDLEITNRGTQPGARRTGVKILADGIGKMERIDLRNLFVHDVNGDLRKDHEGCGIFFEANRKNESHFDGLLIEKCRVMRTDRNGICQRGSGKVRSRNVIIRENTLDDIGGDGIKLWGTDGGLIERNVVRKARARCAPEEAAAGIWPFACDDTIIQFNEVSGTLGTKDGQSFDSDYWCRRTTIQYNYSHENEGGFLLICSPGNAVNADTIVRYNISVNDGIKSARVIHFGGGATGTQIYNNTVVLSPSQQLPLLLFTAWNGANAKNSLFSNNLFLVQEGGRATYDFGASVGNTFASNVFAGRHEGLPTEAVTSPAPALVGPFHPAPGFKSAKAYSPAPGKPFPRGHLIAQNGGRDFFGNPVSTHQAPAVGAIEPAR